MALRLSPQAFTSQDFDSILADALAAKNAATPLWTDDNVSSLGRALLEQAAGIADMLHWSLNQRANQLFPASITVYKFLLQMAKWLNYEVRRASAATVDLTVTRTTSATSVTVPIYTAVRTTGSSSIQFLTTEEVVFEIGETSKTIAAQQGTHIEDETHKTSGLARQRVTLASTPFLWESESVTVGVDAWTRVENFLSSGAADKHYVVEVDENERAAIVFGDNTNGFVPPLGSLITIDYWTGGGAFGNVPAGTLTLMGAVNGQRFSVTNVEAAQGGSDRETLASAKINAPASVTTNRRSVSSLDFEINAAQVPGILRVNALTVNDDPAIDEGTVVLYVVPEYDPETETEPDPPSTALKKRVLDYLLEKRPTLVTARVIAANPNYVDISPDITVKVRGLEYTNRVTEQIKTNLRNWFDLSAQEPDGSYRINWGDTVYLSKIYDLVWNVNDDLGAQIVRDVTVSSPLSNYTLLPSQIPIVAAGTITVTVEQVDEGCA